jgi:predicted nucleic acid-binding protein
VTHGLDTSILVAVEVACHADHVAARTLASSLRQKGDRFALAPQTLAEFVHTAIHDQAVSPRYVCAAWDWKVADLIAFPPAGHNNLLDLLRLLLSHLRVRENQTGCPMRAGGG